METATSSSQNRCYFQSEVQLSRQNCMDFLTLQKMPMQLSFIFEQFMTSMLTLIIAKTETAPLNKQSIPRLELCGAQLLAKLLAKVQPSLKVNLDNTYTWSDSTIVLHWLDGNPKRYKTFVGNRISTILELLPSRC